MLTNHEKDWLQDEFIRLHEALEHHVEHYHSPYKTVGMISGICVAIAACIEIIKYFATK